MTWEGPFKPHHIDAAAADLAGNNGLGRYVFLPGSDGRAKAIAGFFKNTRVLPSDRGHNIYLGTLDGLNGRPVEVASVSSGMGCPSVDIIATELMKLGARRLLRVGTAGSLQPKSVRVPSIVIATGAVRDEGTSRHYLPVEFPAVASHAMVEALEAAAVTVGVAGHTFSGIVHSKDSLFAREFGEGPNHEDNHTYMQKLAVAGVLASEMEASHLFTLAQVHGHELRPVGSRKDDGGILAGCVLAIIGDDRPFAPPDDAKAAIDQTIAVALEGIRILAMKESERTI
jgi:uridine phosphorylase